MAERIAVISEYDKHRTTSYLPKMFGCSKAQISFILKNRKAYELQWQKQANPQRVRRAISPHILTIGIVLFEYVLRLRHYPIEVNDENLKSMGKDIADMLGMKTFKTSKRWLERFKHCYRLDDSRLLSSDVINDGKKKKSLQLTDVFRDVAQDLRKKGVDIMNLNDDHLNVLKTKRTAMVNESLTIDPRGKKIKTSNSNDFEKTIPPLSSSITDGFGDEEPPVEYVEILSDPYESDDNSKTSSNVNNYSENGYYSNSKSQMNEPKEIQNYDEALEHLKVLEEFAFGREDFRALGFINHLENYYKDRMQEIEK